MGKLQKILMPLFLMAISFGLAGCGGGDSAFTSDGGSGGPGTTGTLAITLVLVNQSTQIPTTVVSATAPGELQATVRDGVLLAGETVTFTTTLGTLNPALGTADTSNAGIATMGLLAGSVEGNGTVTATVTNDAETVQTTLGFTIVNNGAGGNGPFITLALLQQSDSKPTNSVSSGQPGRLQATVTVKDNEGKLQPLENEVVTFTSPLGNLSPPAGTKLTDEFGVSSVGLLDGGVAGAGMAIAAVTIDEVTIQDVVNFEILAGTVATTTIDMGNGTGSSFTSDVISLGGGSPLSAGGTLTATVNIVETTNANSPYTTPAIVTFTSTCEDSNLASLDSPVTTTNGEASSTYRAQGCSGTDKITASVDIGGTTYTAKADVTVQPAAVGSIQFTSATPQIIALQGTGGSGLSETSTVVFTVFDESGAVVPNQKVDFTLSTSVGGISLSQAEATTNASGQVQTVVNSGAVNTSVRVTATVATTSITTQSVSLAVSTGIPDNNSFTVSAETLNPSAWDCNGLVVPISARVADHFNNPAPDGTAVAFQAEGGFIDGSCTTVGGDCTVNWTSNDPRPTNARVTILASVIGEEGFTDTNGNGRFDDGEPYTDLPEAWRDDDESNTRDADVGKQIFEEFLDFNESGTYDPANGLYNGTLCAASSTKCDPNGTLVHNRDDLVLVMSSVNQIVTLYETVYNPGTKKIDSTLIDAGNPILLPDDGSVRTFRVDVQDKRGQVPPAGTTISVATTNGEVVGGKTTDVLNDNSGGPSSLDFSMKGDTSPNQGVLTISVKIPGNDCQGEFTLTVGATVSDTLDVTPPIVASTVPAPGATGVAVDVPALEVAFSEALDVETLNITDNGTTNRITVTPTPNGTALDFIASYDSTTNKVFLFPDADFTVDTLYTVTVSGLVQDTTGNYLNGGTVTIDSSTNPPTTTSNLIDHTYIFKTAP